MKQGTANHTSNPKDGITCNEVSPAGAGQIGLAQARMAAVEPLYQGRSYEAPQGKVTVHKSGSQHE